VSHDRTFLDNVVTQDAGGGVAHRQHRHVARVPGRLQRLGCAAARRRAAAEAGAPSATVQTKAAGDAAGRPSVARTKTVVRRTAGVGVAAGRDRGAGARAARAHRADMPPGLPSGRAPRR
jgi:hypothetical protein